MNRLSKWWRLAVVVLLAWLALQTGVSLLVRTARARSFLTRQLESSFGRAVDVREYSVTLFPAPQLDAYAVTVGEDPQFGQEYFLRAERLSAGLRWFGLLRGRFELGTLQLDRPSLNLVRNAQGRWNLERWLPAAPSVPRDSASARGSGGPAAPTHLLRKIAISDGRVDFKLDEDKTPFAFVQVAGAVEQMAPGRWRLDLEAAPWRSGAPLQLAGTVRVRGDVAGTSARLQPAHLQLSWEDCSLADVFRLIGGRDFGVRGSFAAEATVDSGGSAGAGRVLPGDWEFLLHARATGIHRWDLTERDDNPRVGLRVKGRWNPGTGTTMADEFTLETPRSNVRGTASLRGIAPSSFQTRVDSAGIQAADLLDWYRAFQPGVSDEIHATQYFTGAAELSGWPLKLNAAGFSSLGGRWVVPGTASDVVVRALRGGAQNGRLMIEPFAINLPVSQANVAGSNSTSSAGGLITVSVMNNLPGGTGNLRIEGQTARVEALLALMSAFGRNLQNGWQLKGRVSGYLQHDWGADRSGWTGRVELTQASAQVAGLNQSLELENLRVDWHDGRRQFTLGKVGAFGASWTGSVEQTGTTYSDVEDGNIPVWSFNLRTDRLEAAELDRWIGPRARPNWLQRLLPSTLGGNPQAASSALLRRIHASGDLRVNELTVEKIDLKEFHSHVRLENLRLNLENGEGQWCGGLVRGNLKAALSANPSYEVSASLDHIALGQMPWLLPLASHLAGNASATLQLHAEGIGKEALLKTLAGKGEIRLARVELRGWDIAGTMAQGAWKPGVSRWPSGWGTFHVSDGGFDLNSLKLASDADVFLLKGSVSFSQQADLTAESHATGRAARPENMIRFLTISGPLTGPRVSLEKATAQQPGD